MDRVSLKEHLEALRQADQQAIELLAKAQADRIKTGHVVQANLIAIAAVVVAIAAIVFSALHR